MASLFILETSLLFSSLFTFKVHTLKCAYCFQHFKVFYTYFFLYLFSEVEEAMEGADPVDQSTLESPKEPFTDSTPTPSYSHDISKPPPPYPAPVIPLHSSLSTISPVTNSPDIPIKVEYLSDPIPIPSPIFLLPGYSSTISTLSSTSFSTSQVPTIITNSTITSFSSQDAPHSVPLPRSTPIIGSLSLPSQALIDPCPSSSYSSVPSEVISLSTRPRVSSNLPQNPTINPFFTNYSCSPKVFSHIISFNKPSEYVFNMFYFIYTCDFFPGQDNRSLLVSAIEW